MKQNDFRGIAVAVVVFALGIIAVGFTGCDFLEDFVKMQGAEEPPTVDFFSGASTEEGKGDSVIDAIRAAVGKDEVSLMLNKKVDPEPVQLGEADKDLPAEGLVLSTVEYQIYTTSSKSDYITDQTKWNPADPIHSANSPDKVTIDGGGRTIAWNVTVEKNPTPLITVGDGVTLVLRNITFEGTPNTTNRASLIQVYYGTLIMESGARLTGNYSKYGGGVDLYDNGKFTMNDGTIIHNTAVEGGGVYARNTFIKTGGTIYGAKTKDGGDEDPGKKNTSTDASSAAIHFFPLSGNITKKRDATAGSTVGLNSDTDDRWDEIIKKD
ncbi:MAG: hypothetical protein LBT00_09130 [Spirochaetaceae bacterium]|jgi:hypothetical protein|nr:hypothetical protein [Spirochaetaceae bacterium]